MNLEVRDAAVSAIGRHAAVTTSGVARMHEVPWGPGVLTRSRSRGVEVDRSRGGVVLTVRIVVRRGRAVIDIVRTVQRSVRDEVARLTGLVAEVVVVVVDLD